MSALNARLGEVTERIRERSRDTRTRYLERVRAEAREGPVRGVLSCSNLAHGFAACGGGEKEALAGDVVPNLGIITAYNDMLSAHQPFGEFPAAIKRHARELGAVAQVASGVPAMCDGVTQGRTGMELSLFSRDVIAMATAVGLAHRMFDAALFLGVCDKIVPGQLIGALSFGSLPAVFVPGGPMPSGLSNPEKSRIRKQFARGEIGRKELLAAESAAYHAPGTCTFYGTANSNQMLMELMGLHIPGSSFANPGTPLREALTRRAVARALEITALGEDYTPVGEVIDERAVVNGVVGLHATGGSTNHTLHLVAIARVAGIDLRWEDFADLSGVIPLLARVYPNGTADVNQFRDAGGIGFIVRELLAEGLLHRDARTIWGGGMDEYAVSAELDETGTLVFKPAGAQSGDASVLAPVAKAFRPDGGLGLLEGNLGRAVIKLSAIPADRNRIDASARVFDSQEAFASAFESGSLTGDLVAVVRFQGPRANGMPELHGLTPALGVLQDRGQRVGLVTDGRMSGASGRVPAAIHVTPEAACGGALARVRDGDRIVLDAGNGLLQAVVDEVEWEARDLAEADLTGNAAGQGRELFAGFRASVGPADRGASSL